MISNPACEISTSVVAVKFRLRRVPFGLFKEVLVPNCIERNVFSTKRWSKIPIEFKILVVLRLLGRANDFDTLAELSNLPLSTCHLIFTQFAPSFVRLFYKDYVYFPTGEELITVMQGYKQMGFNGAVGSIDCTHVVWNKCPASVTNLTTGKEKCPTIVFQCIVDHDKRIMSCSNAFYGTANDKQIVKEVPDTLSIINGSLNDITYTLYNEDGSYVYCKGAFLISDGGFLELPCFIDPKMNGYSYGEVRWMEFLESVRKDVECFFGIFKCRFRYFLKPIESHSIFTIQSAFHCCCILHNMILEYDKGFLHEISFWEDESINEIDPDSINENNIQDFLNRYHGVEVNGTYRSISYFLNDLSPSSNQARVALKLSCCQDKAKLKSMLVKSFGIQMTLNQVVWPKRFSLINQTSFPISQIVNRITNEVFNSLYRKPSSLLASTYVHGIRTNVYELSIGDGLFSTLSYDVGDVIAEFHGKKITQLEAIELNRNNKAGYVVYLNKSNCLDCSANRFDGTCMASLCNSPLHCWNTILQQLAAANGKLCNRTVNGVRSAFIIATIPIPANTEILMSYGNRYNTAYDCRL